MAVVEPYQRYQMLQQYVGWTAEDAQRVQALRPLVEPVFDDLITDFYDAIQQEPNAGKVITGGEVQVDRLKVTLRGWLDELFSGKYDRDYAVRRWSVGHRHVEIGLPQVYTDMALSRLRKGLIGAISKRWTGEAAELARSITSVNQLIDIDLAMIADAYQSEQLVRQQRAERLATIGQVAGGVAHELRNPLNVVKTSAYYLMHAKNPSPEKVKEHLLRIERQVGQADEVITALNGFAKLPLPEFRPVSLKQCLESVLETLSVPASIEVILESPEPSPEGLADAAQLQIVLSNLVRNAIDAMASGGQLRLQVTTGNPLAVVSVSDTGVGIPPEQLARITEPLYSTKARGIGLGLAIAKAILDKHNATLNVESEVGTGTTFTVSLPAAVS